MLDFPCRPKQEIGEEHLFNLVKRAREASPRKGVGNVESAQILEVPREGGEDEASKLRKELSQLDFYFSDCMSCPANATSDRSGAGVEATFGCHMEIRYPVRSQIESALLTAGIDALENPGANPGSRLVMGILKSQPSGKKTPANRVRRMGRDYFESKAAKAVKVESMGTKVVVDTDQLMTLLMLGPVPPQATGAFATLIDRGLERAKREGVIDPRQVSPLVRLSLLMKAAKTLGKQVKVSY